MLSETREKKQGNPRLAVLNRDDASYDYLHALAQVRQVSYGLGGEADLTASQIRYEGGRMHFRVSLRGMGIDQEITTNLLGDYNVSNCLAAFATAVEGLGIDPAVAAKGIAALPGIPGRMERIDLGQDFTAIVDFAHTPERPEGGAGAGAQDDKGTHRARDRHLRLGGAARPREKKANGGGLGGAGRYHHSDRRGPAHGVVGGYPCRDGWRRGREGRGGGEELLPRTGPGRSHPPGGEAGEGGGPGDGLREGARAEHVLWGDRVPLGRPHGDESCPGGAAGDQGGADAGAADELEI